MTKPQEQVRNIVNAFAKWTLADMKRVGFTKKERDWFILKVRQYELEEIKLEFVETVELKEEVQ